MSSVAHWTWGSNTPCPALPDSDFSPENGSKSGALSTLGIMAGIVPTCLSDVQRQDAVKRRFTLQGNARALLPGWRVSDCLRVPHGGLVSVVHHPEFSTASFGGLHTCGNPHVCPVCGSKISERRTAEVNAAAAAWLDRGGSLVMCTFTLQHELADSLADLGGAMNEGYRYLRKQRRWQLFAQRVGLLGSVTARECTHGAHGWHPHLHSLLLLRSGLARRDLVALEDWLAQNWARSLAKNGRFASLRHGVNCRLSDNGALAQYVTKAGKSWTVGDELAKANTKVARRGGRSVAQLLWDSGQGDEQAGHLFVEYANWTYRKNALVWSPGLRSMLGLDEVQKSDKQLAAEEVAAGRVLVVFHRHQWHVILGNDVRAELLLVAAAGDVDRVVMFVRQFSIELEPWQLEPLMHSGEV